MLNPSFDQHYFFDSHPSADTSINGYPSHSTWPYDSALDRQTDSLVPDTSWIPHENAFSLSGTSAPELGWAADLSACTPHTSNQIDTQVFGTSLLHRPSAEGVGRLWQPPAFQVPLVCEEELVGFRRTAIGHSVYPITPPGTHLIREPTAHSLNRCAGPFKALDQPTPPCSLRHTPYPMRQDRTKRLAPPPSVYQCQWSDGVTPCGAAVAGTKIAIGRHLQAAHAVRLEADRAIQVCRWEMCHGRPMRRESIARHILAVHMQHKAICPNCGSRFARMDSLQRHQRTQCLAAEEESGACKADM